MKFPEVAAAGGKLFVAFRWPPFLRRPAHLIARLSRESIGAVLWFTSRLGMVSDLGY